MKTFLVFLLSVVLLSCGDKKLGPEEISPLVGKWRLEAVEEATGEKKWKPISAKEGYVFEVRYDGVILDAGGLPACCAPSSLLFNGQKFVIEPKESLPQNPSCALVLCMACDTWEMNLQNDTLIVRYCSSAGNRFVRE